MIDEDDVGNAFLFGGIPLAVIFLICYLVFSKPQINTCHEKGGVIVRIEGADKCVAKDAMKEIGK